MRLAKRNARFWSRSYLAYASMWPNIETAVGRAKAALDGVSRKVLDIGCGQKPYADLFADCEYIGLNHSADDADPDIVGTAISLPIASDSIDLAFCTQVLEHVPEPALLLSECHRVLKPGRYLVMTAPFYWPLHEEPHDYFRFTKHGLKLLSERAGFEAIELWPDGGDYARLFLSILHSTPAFLEILIRVPCNLFGRSLDLLSPRHTFPANYTALMRKPMNDARAR
jgi:SAM-dependent methyltransferase